MTEHPWRLIARHLAGEGGEDDARALERWMRDDPAHADLLESLETIWQEGRTAVPSRDVDAAWLRLTAEAALGSQESGDHPSDGAPIRPRARAAPRSSPGRALLRAAAVVAIALLSAEVVAFAVAPDPVDPVALPPLRQVTSEIGATTRAVLPDGTQVLLAPGSTLTFPTAFRGAARDVRVVGTGYFDVATDEAHPFRVRAAGTVTRVLGTRFSIRAVPGEDEVRVAVEEGRVALSLVRDAGEVRLDPGDLGLAASSGGLRRAPGAAGDEDLGWTSGRLSFRRAPVDRVLRDLERWFAVDLVAPESLRRRTITLTVESETATEVLELLSLALDATVDVEGRTARLVPRPPTR